VYTKRDSNEYPKLIPNHGYIVPKWIKKPTGEEKNVDLKQEECMMNHACQEEVQRE
ncbi:hypothetical protein KI387_005484, partial [Taxus chinensis]